MYNAHRVFFAAILSIVAIGCTQGAQLTPDSIATAAPSAPAVSGNSTCQPPCFSGIVPGKTSVDEAITYLHVSGLGISPNYFWWSTPKSVGRNWIHFTDSRVVDTIVVKEPSGTTLGDVIEQYAEPDIVLLGNPGVETPLAQITFVYVSRGVAFLGERDASDVESVAEKYIPTPDMIVQTEVYFVPTDEKEVTDLVDWGLATSIIEVSPWKGFEVSHWPQDE